MSDSIALANSDIKKILNKVEKKYHLEIYRVLKNAYIKDKKSFEKIKKDILTLLKDPNLPRPLTDEELDTIVDGIPLMPSPLKEISVDNNKQVKELVRRQLSKQKFSIQEGTVQKLKKIIREQYLKSAVDPGDSVGVNGAMSIGEPLTQANLNTFHSAGAKTQEQGGLKAIDDLFKIPEVRSIENTIVHYKDKNLTKEEIINLSYSFTGISVRKMISYQDLMSELPEEDLVWYKNYNLVTGSKFVYKGNKFLRLFININSCYKYNISIKDIARTIEKNSRSSITRKTVTCVITGTSRGIIDIHAEKIYIKNMLENYEKTVCSTTKLKKNKFPPVQSLEDLYDIFLSVFLSECFNEMLIKGIKNIENFTAAEPINLIKTFETSPVSSLEDLEKFSQPPHNLPLEEIDNLWIIRIRKQYKLFDGIPEEKFVNLFEACGFTIIENQFNETRPVFIVLMPEPTIIKYFNTNDKKSYQKYSLRKNDKYYDNEGESYLTNYNPKMCIEMQLEYEKKSLVSEIDTILIENKKITELNYRPIYRYAYYSYGIAFGKKIIRDLMNHKLVDSRYTYPNNVRQINSLLGIEAARFYFANKYLTTTLEEVNPLNMDLIIDFQTASGQLLKITSSGVASQGASIITSVAFQNSMDYLEKGTAMGEKDRVKGISSCIMTGSTCKNGTGIVKVEFDGDYLNDESNLNNFESNLITKLEEDDIVGPCNISSITGERNDEVKDTEEEDIARDIPDESYSSELTIKEKMHSPPKMEMPDFLDQDLGIPEEPEDLENVLDLGIPEEPEDLENVLDLGIPEEPEETPDL